MLHPVCCTSFWRQACVCRSLSVSTAQFSEDESRAIPSLSWEDEVCLEKGLLCKGVCFGVCVSRLSVGLGWNLNS